MLRFFKRFALACCFTIAASLDVVLVVFAQTAGPYDLSWHNIGHGGSYGLHGSIC